MFDRLRQNSCRDNPNAMSSSDEAYAQNGQDRKLAFVNASIDRRTTSPDRVTKPASPHVVAGRVRDSRRTHHGPPVGSAAADHAQVTENIYDTPTGRSLLIPQGARLIGVYDSQVAFGQSRVLLVWTRLILPNGRSIVMERQPGTDPGGYAGLEDGVDYHWDAMFKAALLLTLLSADAGPGLFRHRRYRRPRGCRGDLGLPVRRAENQRPGLLRSARAGIGSPSGLAALAWLGQRLGYPPA